MRKVTTRYETMIRHDESGRFKGGHHVDIIRYVPDKGEAEADMPPPFTTDAMPLTFEDMSVYLADDAASALAEFSALKGQEIAARAALARAQSYIEESNQKMIDLADKLDAAQAQIEKLSSLNSRGA